MVNKKKYGTAGERAAVSEGERERGTAGKCHNGRKRAPADDMERDTQVEHRTDIAHKAGRWYKGDLHLQTAAADGRYAADFAQHKAALRELDFYVPTAPNAVCGSARRERVMAWPGMEISSSIGRMNLLGADSEPRAREGICSHSNEELLQADYEDIISECKNRGWLIGMSAPFDPACRWRWHQAPLADLDCLEITDEKTIALSDLLWEDGYRICAVSGSRQDADGMFRARQAQDVDETPDTWLYMEDLSASSLKKAVRACHGYVSRGCMVRTNLMFGTQLPQAQRELDFEICLYGCREKPRIFFRHNGLKHYCTGLRDDADGWHARGSIRLNEETPYHCIRFGAQMPDGSFLFYANPITKGTAVHRFITFGEAEDQIMKETRQQSVRVRQPLGRIRWAKSGSRVRFLST